MALVSALVSAGCFGFRSTPAPLPVIELAAGDGSGCEVILLPGRGDRPERFGREGFAAAAGEAGVGARLLAADAHLGYYRNRTVVDRLERDVVGPARSAGRQVRLAGVSLGGLGSLLYAFRQPGEVSGLVLIAPFLGGDEVLSEIEAAGGLAGWTPGPVPADGEPFDCELWRRLKAWDDGELELPPVWLAYGVDDRLAPGHRLLASALPAERVVALPGGHDWATWGRLWRHLLAAGALDCAASAAAGHPEGEAAAALVFSFESAGGPARGGDRP